MKKSLKILIIIAAGAVFGFTMSFLIHNMYWDRFKTSLKTFSIWLYIILPFVFFFLAILVHELGHLFSFIFSKIKIRALYVLVFVIRRNVKGKWRFEIYPKNIKLLGGLVVPNLPEITTEEEYNGIRRKFTNALIWGPIISGVYFLLSIISFVLVWFLTSSYFWIAFLFIHLIVITLMTILIMLSSKLHTEEMYGDFVAYRKFKEDNTFALAQIEQYTMFSLFNLDKTDDFLFNKIVTHYKNNQYPTYSIMDISLLSNYISKNLEKETIDTSLDSLIELYNINVLLNKSNGIELAFLISSYYYKKEDVKRSYEIIDNIKSNRRIKASEFEIEFYTKVYEHSLNLDDHTTYILDNQEKIFESINLLAPVIDLDKIKKAFLIKLDFVEYVTSLED